MYSHNLTSGTVHSALTRRCRASRDPPTYSVLGYLIRNTQTKSPQPPCSVPEPRRQHTHTHVVRGALHKQKQGPEGPCLYCHLQHHLDQEWQSVSIRTLSRYVSRVQRLISAAALCCHVSTCSSAIRSCIMRSRLKERAGTRRSLPGRRRSYASFVTLLRPGVPSPRLGSSPIYGLPNRLTNRTASVPPSAVKRLY